MKTRFFFFNFLCTLMLICSAQGNSTQYVLLNAEDSVPADYPLRLLNTEQNELGNIMDWEVRSLTMTLKNTTEKPVSITRIISGCPCLVLKDQQEAILVKPKEDYKFIVQVHGSKLREGAFSRVLYVEIQDQPYGQIAFAGVLERKIFYFPAHRLDMGITTAQANWKRSFRLTSQFAQDSLKILPPKQSELFKFDFKKVSPQVYVLDVTPRKLPLPLGEHAEAIIFPTVGIPNYGPITTAIRIIVSSPELTVISPKTIIDTKQDMGTESVCATATIQTTLKKSPKWRTGRNIRTKRIFGIAYWPITEKEGNKATINDLKHWENIMKDIKVTPSEKYPEISFKLIPQQDHLDIQVIFPKGYFAKHTWGILNTPVMFKGKSIGDLHTRW